MLHRAGLRPTELQKIYKIYRCYPSINMHPGPNEGTRDHPISASAHPPAVPTARHFFDGASCCMSGSLPATHTIRVSPLNFLKAYRLLHDTPDSFTILSGLQYRRNSCRWKGGPVPAPQQNAKLQVLMPHITPILRLRDRLIKYYAVASRNRKASMSSAHPTRVKVGSAPLPDTA